MFTTAATARSTLTTASVVVFLFATTLTGCTAAGDPAPEPPADAAAPEAGETGDTDADDTGDDTASNSGDGGTVTFNSTVYTVEETYNCEIFPDDTAGAPERSLDLIALGTSSTGAEMQLNVLLQTSSGLAFNSVDYSGDEGIYSNEGDAVVREDGDTIIGAVTVTDDANTQIHMLQFTLVVPDETIDCR